MFYTSGSPRFPSENKFLLNNLSIKSTVGEQFLKKYHGYPSSSVITIPSKYYGEKIKEGSFHFTDVSGSNVDSNGNNPIIVDDGFGNLYATATICSSLPSAPSTYNFDPFELELFIFILIFLFEFNKSLLKSSTTEFTTFDKLIFVIFALDKAASSFNICE